MKLVDRLGFGEMFDKALSKGFQAVAWGMANYYLNSHLVAMREAYRVNESVEKCLGVGAGDDYCTKLYNGREVKR